MHPHVRRGPGRDTGHSSTCVSALVPVSPRGGHKGGLAAAVIEQVHVRVPEVSVRQTVDDVVEAGLAHSHPRTVVERSVRDFPGGGQAADDCEWGPEQDEDDEAVEIGLGQGQVAGEPVVGLEVRLANVSLHGHVHAEVDDKGDEEGDQSGRYSNGDNSLRKQLVVLSVAIFNRKGPRGWTGPCLSRRIDTLRGGRHVVRVDELERAEQETDQPDEEEHSGGVGFGEPIVLRIILVLTYQTQSHIVLDGRRLMRGRRGTRTNGRVSAEGIHGIYTFSQRRSFAGEIRLARGRRTSMQILRN